MKGSRWKGGQRAVLAGRWSVSTGAGATVRDEEGGRRRLVSLDARVEEGPDRIDADC